MIRLNTGFWSDLAWWNTFIAKWNGVSFLSPPSHLPQLEVTSDASGLWGCGACHNRSWFQVQWDSRAQALSIAEKELIPIILALTAWGGAWANCQIICHCDNQVVVACLRSRTSKYKGVMHLLRSLSRLDLSAPEPSVQHHFQNGLAPSTQKTYIPSCHQTLSFIL